MEKQNDIQKPLILLYKECNDNLINVINNSGLPAFLLERIIKDLYMELQSKSKLEYNSSLQYYEKNRIKEKAVEVS